MRTLTIAHSPDPDDVFMWWPLGSANVAPDIDTEGLRFEPIPEDIQVLNRRAIEKADLDITAISMHAYPHICKRYQLTACAGSFGDSYGPKVVARKGAFESGDDAAKWLSRDGITIAIPGAHTTAYLTLRLLLDRDFQFAEMRFDGIPGAVAEGRVDAGLLIHDAQLTYGSLGLVELADLGVWWRKVYALPLPLGGNVVRRDLEQEFGAGTLARVARVLHRSIRHALDNMDEGLGRIRGLYPTLDDATLRKYLGMYVSPLTLDPGTAGRDAIVKLLTWGAEKGLCPNPGKIDILPN